MNNRSSGLPRSMRQAGWALFALTLLYPLDAVRTWYVIRDLLGSEVPIAPPSGGAMTFDLRTPIIHCGILGWLGSVGALLSPVWLLSLLVGWGSRRLRRGC